MTEVERLAAIEAIKQVKSRYFRFGDTKDLVAMRELFTEDCVADLTGSLTDPTTGVDIFPTIGSQVLRGVDAIMAAYGAGEGISTVHHGYNAEIEITGDTTATAIFSMTDRLFFSEVFPIASLTGYGHYHETYEKIGDKWLIKTLRLTRLRIEVVNRG